MKYIALLSGGKDSCYNLLHCHRNGHELVAAASLRPGPGKEELDSYLYQTVGQDAIESVARALDVPLYRRVISGTALVQDSEYGGRNVKERGGVTGDETEDLYALLADVKSQHPGAKGVSVGAILSNYQRVRVEHVCQRLSLTPLSYLWQRDQAELLSEMISAGMHAVLIKVAGIGLTTKHLGKTLSEMQHTLVTLNTLYGSHICGEGGEYETLTLDCPLFKRRITLHDTETVIHSDGDFATVAFLRILHASLDSKPDHVPELAVPALLDQPYLQVAEHLQTMSPINDKATDQFSCPNTPICIQLPSPTFRSLGNWISVGNVHRDLAVETDVPLEDEIRECFHILQKCLSEHSLSLSHIANVNIFISSMDDFASINAVYATYFGVSPPARACVAVDLPHSLRVMLDCVAYAEQKVGDRKALHVQGLSYWAPANIGPYSQAIVVDERVFISGQIGLVPSSMSMPSPQNLATEVPLASQHADRIVKALSGSAGAGGGWDDCHAQLILYWAAEERHVSHAITAAQRLDRDATPTLFLVVRGLPKGALIEKQVLYHTGRGFCADDDGDEGDTATPVSCPASYSTEAFSEGDTEVRSEVSHLEHATASAVVIWGRGSSGWAQVPHRLKAIAQLEGSLARALSVRLFYKVTAAADLPPIQGLFHLGSPAITPVPCRCIRTRDESDWDYALCILSA